MRPIFRWYNQILKLNGIRSRSPATTNQITYALEERADDVPPSKQYSDSLFHFTKDPELIAKPLQRCGFTLNYVREDFTYLGISGLSSVAFPMLCFCDILDERARLRPHEMNYGGFGIGLKKTWGRHKGVQPVHYLVPGSPFVKDLQAAFDIALQLDESESPSGERGVSDFLVTTLAYAKPVWGLDGEGKDYCFEDECEWRYVPSDLHGLPPFIPEPTDGMLANYRQTIWRPETFLLTFSYADVDSILVPTDEDVRRFIAIINELDATDDEKDMLKTKLRRS